MHPNMNPLRLILPLPSVFRATLLARMSRRGLAIVVATTFYGLSMPTGKAAITILNEGLNNTGNASNIHNANDSGKAINFIMPAGSNYTLSHILLGLDQVDNNESPVVQIWSNEATSTPIGVLLHTLTNPGTLVNGANTFTSSGFTLQASTTYWVIVKGANANPFGWVGGTDTTISSDIGATHSARLFPSGLTQPSPANWTGVSGVLNQIQIYAVPEPSSALLGVCGAILLLRRRRISGQR